MKRFAATLLLSSAVVAGLVGCGGSGSAPAGPGRVRVINALPSSAASAGGNGLDVTASPAGVSNPSPIGTSVAYGTINGGSVQFSSGPATVTAYNAGTTTNPVATSAGITIVPAIDQVLLVAGQTAPMIVNLGRLNLDTGSIPTSGQARVYLVNAVEGSGTVNFNYSVTPDPTNGNFSSKAVPYGQMSNEIIVGTGTAQVSATVGGQSPNSSFTIAGQKVYIVILTGKTVGTPGLGFSLITLT